MIRSRRDPGSCMVCGADHSTCTAADGDKSIVVRQLPARDGVRPGSLSVSLNPGEPAGLGHDQVLARERAKHPNAFSTRTYRSRRRGRKP